MNKCIIFDLDGTLINSSNVTIKAFNTATNACGVSGRFSIDDFFSFAGAPLDNVCHMMGLPLDFVDHYRAESKRLHGSIYMFPGIESLLKELHQSNISMAILTGKDRDSTISILSILGIKEIFESIITPDDKFEPKPSSEPVLAICSDLGISSKDSLFVGDSQLDMKCAVASNMKAIGCTWGVATENQLLDAGADVIVENVQSLYDKIALYLSYQSISS